MATLVRLGDSSPTVVPDPVLQEAKRVIGRGGVLAFPTESFYALGASPWDGAAVRRVWQIKGRPPGKPILVLIGETSQLAPLVEAVPPAASVLMAAFWPGPLTIVFPAVAHLPVELTGGTGSVGVRFMPYPALASLLRQVGPLTGTSANRSGQPPARTATEVQAALGDEVDLIVDGGPTAGAEPSTLVSTLGAPRLLREGPISAAEVKAVLAGAGFTLAR